jgi:hypothetical protein
MEVAETSNRYQSDNATVSAKRLASLEEVPSEGTGEDGGAEVAFKESGFMKPEVTSYEHESEKIKSSGWKFGGDTGHGTVTIPDQYAPPIFIAKKWTRKSGFLIWNVSQHAKSGRKSSLVSFSHSA